MVAWNVCLEKSSPFLMVTYLENLSAAACSKGSPNVMLFEVITYVFASCSALLFLIVG